MVWKYKKGHVMPFDKNICPKCESGPMNIRDNNIFSGKITVSSNSNFDDSDSSSSNDSNFGDSD